jgi:hypothetical protein
MSSTQQPPHDRHLALTLVLLAACNGGAGETEGTETQASVTITTATTTSTTTGPTGTDTQTSESDTLTTTDPTDTGEPACADTCEGGVCIDDLCCPAELACGAICCPGGQVCSFQTCVLPGATCVDATDCGEEEYCEYSLGEDREPPDPMCMGGASLATGKCLPTPPECAMGVEPDPDEPECLAACEVKPPIDDFAIQLKYAWGGEVTPPYSSDVMMTPIVIQLDDDNCDGKVNEKDIPEIVFSTFTGGAYFKQGALHAISIVDGAIVEKLNIPDITQPGGGLAGGDLDGDGVPEIVACMNPGPAGMSCCDALAQNTGVIALRADGSTLWTQADNTRVHCGYESPAIGDVDGDGVPEVLVGWTLLSGVTGEILKELDPATQWSARLTSLVDLDGDGRLDVTDGQRAYKATGELLWDLRPGNVKDPANAIPIGYHGVGDFDKDGAPEVVIISSSGPHTMALIRHDPRSLDGAAIIRKGVDINDGYSTIDFCNAGAEYGGGPPTVADFNGDGVPDVGAAGAVGYVVLDGKKLIDPDIATETALLKLWFRTTQDCSSAVTGSSVFDFNGDGKAEVIYNDENHLWMYDGLTGENLIESTCSTTGTLWEYPLVADVDNDGQADIVVASNAYAVTCPDDNSKQSGLRIFGSASGSWVRTRRIWNQHTYHVTNIEESGAVPAAETPNWTVKRLNNFRQNVQPAGEFAAPDLTGKILVDCLGDYTLTARIRNVGQAAVPAGVPIAFFEGPPAEGKQLGLIMTTKALYPAEAEDIILVLPDPPPSLKLGLTEVHVVIDHGMPEHPWTECRLDNNEVHAFAKCSVAG